MLRRPGPPANPLHGRLRQGRRVQPLGRVRTPHPPIKVVTDIVLTATVAVEGAGTVEEGTAEEITEAEATAAEVTGATTAARSTNAFRSGPPGVGRSSRRALASKHAEPRGMVLSVFRTT